ncbi:hypothetical protein [Xanthovirga aplysinae]|uniref:hypothetical protein n=1 Tax=Xanthovirga aplysinae TaxID=2529853 RepID=UPI0012BBE015|nr:hypothetical protein [Xanthovirga aplysinae]MTI33457.1 hypothetical protein [Xanthovirga aplysinae]
MEKQSLCKSSFAELTHIEGLVSLTIDVRVVEQRVRMQFKITNYCFIVCKQDGLRDEFGLRPLAWSFWLVSAK